MSSIGEIIPSVVTSLCSAGGLGMFVRHWVNGVKSQIQALNSTIEAQQKTLEVMERRATEIGKIGEDFKKLSQELPETFEKALAATRRAKDVEIDALTTETELLRKQKGRGEKQQTVSSLRPELKPPGEQSRLLAVSSFPRIAKK